MPPALGNRLCGDAERLESHKDSILLCEGEYVVPMGLFNPNLIANPGFRPLMADFTRGYQDAAPMGLKNKLRNNWAITCFWL